MSRCSAASPSRALRLVGAASGRAARLQHGGFRRSGSLPANVMAQVRRCAHRVRAADRSEQVRESKPVLGSRQPRRHHPGAAHAPICGYTGRDVDTVFAPNCRPRPGRHPGVVQRLRLAGRRDGVQSVRRAAAVRMRRFAAHWFETGSPDCPSATAPRRIEGHLFIAVPACQLVWIVRLRLRGKRLAAGHRRLPLRRRNERGTCERPPPLEPKTHLRRPRHPPRYFPRRSTPDAGSHAIRRRRCGRRQRRSGRIRRLVRRAS